MADSNPFYEFVFRCAFYLIIWLVNWFIMALITQNQVKRRGGIGITMWQAMNAPGVWLYSAALTAVPVVMHKVLKNVVLSYEQRLKQIGANMKAIQEKNADLGTRLAEAQALSSGD
eukprot:jgi/Mesvir1/21/Mv19999-RA.1